MREKHSVSMLQALVIEAKHAFRIVLTASIFALAPVQHHHTPFGSEQRRQVFEIKRHTSPYYHVQ
jgi:hypothetical protein